MLVKQTNKKFVTSQLERLHYYKFSCELVSYLSDGWQHGKTPIIQFINPDGTIMQKCLGNNMIKGQANTLKESIWASDQADNEE